MFKGWGFFSPAPVWVELSRMPSSALIPFLGGLGSLINPFKPKRAPCLSLGYWAAEV